MGTSSCKWVRFMSFCVLVIFGTCKMVSYSMGFLEYLKHICKIISKFILIIFTIMLYGNFLLQMSSIYVALYCSRHLRRLPLPHRYFWSSFDSKVFFVLSCCLNINIYLQKKKRAESEELCVLYCLIYWAPDQLRLRKRLSIKSSACNQ
jgi:purine-cytosine permease-like protein